MNRKEAEKLLTALIFDDLDEASKTNLTAYLQTDDELRERLADMRMAVKVASDALQHGPDPVLGKRRLKRLARLARRSRRPAVFTMRHPAAAAAILIAIMLSAFLLFMPSLNKVKMYSHSQVDHLELAYNIRGGVVDNIESDTSALRRLESLGYVGGEVTEKSSFAPDPFERTTEESMEGKKLYAKVTPTRNEINREELVTRDNWGIQVQSSADADGRKLNVDYDTNEMPGSSINKRLTDNFTSMHDDATQAIIDSSTKGEMVKLGEARKKPLLGDIPVVGGLLRDSRGRLAGAKDMGSIGKDIVSPSEKEAMDTEARAGLGVVHEKHDYSRVVNSIAPVSEDESDLPLSARFKSVPVNPWVMTERDELSTFALDVDTASYTLCRRYIYGGLLPPAGAVRMEEFVNYFNYHYPQRTGRTFMVHAEAAASPFADKGKNLTLLKVAVKARTIGRDQRKAAHLIFVVDTSASMGKPDRLGLVQQALNLLIDELSDADRVSLITCANESRLHLEATSLRHRDRIRQAINAIQTSGPTNLLAGLKLGYATARRSFDAKQINHVVLCSDGVANVGQTEAAAVLKAVAADKKQGITITCVGVGYGSYNDAFMESLANSGDGSYVFLDSARQAQRVFVEQLAATLHNVAKDARIQVSFNPQRVRRYRLIGYENRDIEDKRFRDDTIDAGEVGSGQCSTALYELELTGQRSADQGEGLGTVFVRYRHADTGRIEEISYRLKSSIVQRLKVAGSPRFFLAAAASRFAEILRQSEHARHGSLTDVLAVAEKVSLALPLDRDVRELAELIRKAEHLPRAQ